MRYQLFLLILLSVGCSPFNQRLDCSGVEGVYNRVKDSLRSSPMYQNFRDKNGGICYRDRNTTRFTPTCCSFDREMALALTSSTLFRTYLFTDTLQDYKYALLNLRELYFERLEDLLGDKIDKFVRTTLQKSDYAGLRSSYRDTMKEQLRLLLEKKEQLKDSQAKVPLISDRCLETAENFIDTFKQRLEVYLTHFLALQNGVSLAEKLLDSLQFQKVSPKCVDAVARSSVMTIGCSQCQMETARFKACRSLCVNVVNGCMKPLLTLLPTWYSWQEVMDHLDFEFMSRQRDLARIDVKKEISDSFMLDYKSLQNRCTVGWVGTSDSTADMRIPRKYSRVSEMGDPATPKYKDMFRNMFGNLQDHFCSGFDLSSEDDTSPCFNGSHVAPYLHDPTSFTDFSQSLNPEVSDNSYLHHTARDVLQRIDAFNSKITYKNGNGIPVTEPGGFRGDPDNFISDNPRGNFSTGSAASDQNKSVTTHLSFALLLLLLSPTIIVTHL